jgi:hypothetical protein
VRRARKLRSGPWLLWLSERSGRDVLARDFESPCRLVAEMKGCIKAFSAWTVCWRSCRAPQID